MVSSPAAFSRSATAATAAVDFTWMPKWATGLFGPVAPPTSFRARFTGGSVTSNLAYRGRTFVGP